MIVIMCCRSFCAARCHFADGNADHMGRRNPWRLRAEAVVDAGDEANRPSPEQARTIRYRLSPAISNPSRRNHAISSSVHVGVAFQLPRRTGFSLANASHPCEQGDQANVGDAGKGRCPSTKACQIARPIPLS